jgi:hypothetical protein
VHSGAGRHLSRVSKVTDEAYTVDGRPYGKKRLRNRTTPESTLEKAEGNELQQAKADDAHRALERLQFISGVGVQNMAPAYHHLQAALRALEGDHEG